MQDECAKLGNTPPEIAVEAFASTDLASTVLLVPLTPSKTRFPSRDETREEEVPVRYL